MKMSLPAVKPEPLRRRSPVTAAEMSWAAATVAFVARIFPAAKITSWPAPVWDPAPRWIVSAMMPTSSAALTEPLMATLGAVKAAVAVPAVVTLPLTLIAMLDDRARSTGDDNAPVTAMLPSALISTLPEGVTRLPPSQVIFPFDSSARSPPARVFRVKPEVLVMFSVLRKLTPAPASALSVSVTLAGWAPVFLMRMPPKSAAAPTVAGSAPVICESVLIARSPDLPPKMLARLAEPAMMLVLVSVPAAFRMAAPALISTELAPALMAPRARPPDAHSISGPPAVMSTRLETWLAGLLSVVAPCDWVFSVRAASRPLCVIAPAGALRLKLATVIFGRFRLPLAWVMLALEPPAKSPSVPPLWLKLELTVRPFAMFKVPPAMFSPAAP